MCDYMTMKPRTTTWRQTRTTRLPDIEAWSALGLLEKEMAARLGVRPSTFSEWKSLHAELAEAIKKGRDKYLATGIDALEASAISRATGYMVTEAETTTEEGPRGNITRTKTTLRHVPADPTLAIWLLSTHRGDVYQRLPAPRSSGDGEEQLRKLAAMIEQGAASPEPVRGADVV